MRKLSRISGTLYYSFSSILPKKNLKNEIVLGENKLTIQTLVKFLGLCTHSTIVFSQILVHFLSRVVAHEKHNKMGLNSVAMIMAPNMFLCTNKSQPTLQEIKHAQGTVNIVRMLIKYQAILWTVSKATAKQGTKTCNSFLKLNEKESKKQCCTF